MRKFLLVLFVVPMFFSCNSDKSKSGTSTKSDSTVATNNKAPEPVNYLELAKLTFKQISEIGVMGMKNKSSEDSIQKLADPYEKLLDSHLLQLTEAEKAQYDEYRGNVLDSIATGKIK